MANQPKRFFHTASEPEIKAGQVSDVYFQRTIQILKAKGLTKRVKAEIRLKIFPAVSHFVPLHSGVATPAEPHQGGDAQDLPHQIADEVVTLVRAHRFPPDKD